MYMQNFASQQYLSPVISKSVMSLGVFALDKGRKVRLYRLILLQILKELFSCIVKIKIE